MNISDLKEFNTPLASPELEKKQPENNESFDLIIIGAGPAGMSAAICAARGGLKTLIIEKALPGGECSTACKIDNLLGQKPGILGEELGRIMEHQLFSHDIFYACETVTDFNYIEKKTKAVITSLGSEYRTKTIILAIGLEPKKLNSSFEEQFLGMGVSYYAQSDPSTYKDKNVIVIGGGNCACYAADYLSNHASHVYIIHSNSHLKSVKTLKQRIESNQKITAMWNSKVTEVFGIDHVQSVKTENLLTGQSTWIDASGVFIYIGRCPPKDIVCFELNLDETGHIITDEYMRTNIPGVYAIGDIRSKQVRQIAPAISDGMIAAINIERDYFR